MRTKYFSISPIFAALFFLAARFFSPAACASESGAPEGGLDVLCVYYPHWHVYPYGEKWFGKGWTEWEFVKTGKPRFKGHKLPYCPIPGYLDGKNPADVAKEIDLASNAGITVFLYDWYWYGGKRTMQESLEEGFLKAPNRDKMKFAIMWAYHDRVNAFRPDPTAPREVLMKLESAPEDFLAALDYCIKHYFKEPNYYKVGGRPFFSIYNAPDFVKRHGGAQNVKKLFDAAAGAMRKNGLPPVHWNAMVGSAPEAEIMKAAGFESTTRYGINAYHRDLLQKEPVDGIFYDYADAVPAHERHWRNMAKSPLPDIPIATMGWDSSMRCRNDVKLPWPEGAKYPYGGFYINNTPDIFGEILAKAKAFALADPKKPGAVLINAWNEYTEGSYLLPDIRDGDGYLRAVASVFGRRPAGEYVYFDCATKKQCSVRAADFENVSYGPHYKNKLDVWLPKGAKGKAPAIIYFHGGGWSTGAIADRFVEASLEKILSKGVAVVAANYRFVQDARDAGIFPPVAAPMEDCAKVVEFVKKNAGKWNVDPGRIAVSGGSAGACSALYVGLSPDCESVAAIGANIPQTSLDPAQMREWIPNIAYGAHAFGRRNFKEWLAAREELLPHIKKYSPAGLVAGAARRGSPKKIFLQNFRKEAAGEVSKDPTHSPKFCEKFAEICSAEKLDCQIVYGSAEKMFDELSDYLANLK